MGKEKNTYELEVEDEVFCIRESVPYMEPINGEYTIDDYYKLPDDQRFELIDGYLYVMLAPTVLHQLIAGEIHRQISNFIVEKNGKCFPLISPIDVQLDRDNKTMVQPDVAILCDKDKLLNRVIYGAPDFVLEVISPSTSRKDYTKKLAKYENAGVREYWIVDPYKEKLSIYNFDDESLPMICGFGEAQGINIYDGELKIDFTRIVEWIKEYRD